MAASPLKRMICRLLVLALLGGGFALAARDAQAGPKRPSVTRAIQRSVQKNIEIKVKRMRLKLKVERSAGPLSAMDLGFDGRFMATFSKDGRLRVWDMAQGRQIRKSTKLKEAVRQIRFLPDGKRFVTLSDKGRVFLRKADDGNFALELGSPQQPASAFAVSANGAFIAIGGRDGTIRLVGPDKKALATFGDGGGPITALDVGDKGQHALAASKDGVAIWETGSGAAIASFPAGAVKALRFGRNETEFFSADDNGRVRYWRVDQDGPAATLTGAKKDLAAIDPSRDGKSVVAAELGGRVLMWNLNAPSNPKVIGEHKGGATAARFDIDGRRVIAAGRDGLTRVWDAETGKPLLTLVSTQNGWAVIDDVGRFDGSDRALRNVQWASDTQVLSVENFSDDFFEPGLLAKRRAGEGQLLTAPQISLTADGVLPPPTTKVSAPAQVSMPQRRAMDVKVVANNEGGGIEEVRLYHNGKIVDPEKISTRNVRKTGDGDTEAVELVYQVQPIAGGNVFGANSVSEERIVGMLGETRTVVDAPAVRPTLHVVVVGVNKYREPDLSLNYAHIDAKGLMGAVKKNFGAIFGDYRAYEVYDDKATGKGILAVLDRLAKTAPEDVVVFYYAGHGESYKDEFYLVPYDFPLPFSDAGLVRHGVPSSELRKRISRIGAGRVVLLMDACKSGTAVSALQDHMDRRALRRLGTTVGLHVIAATAKEQFAAELHHLKHGVFTYTLIKGLTGGADGGRRDGNVTVREITRFAETQVPEFSMKYARHQQWPLVYSRGLDFTLHRAR